LSRRVFGRQQLNIWDEQDDHAGALVAIEGSDQGAVTVYADAIEDHLRAQGLATVRVRSEEPADRVPRLREGGPDSPADALRATADLADLSTTRISPALQAAAVVVCEGFLDAAIVRYRAIGLEEQRLARVAQWAVNGLKPDLTLVVDAPSSGSGRANSAMNGGADGRDSAVVGAGHDLEDERPAREDSTSPVTTDPADDEDEPVDLAQAYRDRASYTPERYMIVQPHQGPLLPEVVERLESVMRQRTPAQAGPQPAVGPDQPTSRSNGTAGSANASRSTDRPPTPARTRS
jgi:dTMP kinase